MADFPDTGKYQAKKYSTNNPKKAQLRKNPHLWFCHFQWKRTGFLFQEQMRNFDFLKKLSASKKTSKTASFFAF